MNTSNKNNWKHIRQNVQYSKDICNNCGKFGHLFRNCKNPILSYGCVPFRITKDDKREYLMICRKDTLGYIDFMRGKYIINDYEYIKNMIKQMTNAEKNKLNQLDFDVLWQNLWIGTKSLSSSSSLYKSEEDASRNKFNTIKKLKLQQLIDSSNETNMWISPEWGFPKGRRNYHEIEYDCALRETIEETGYDASQLIHLKNIAPFEEGFIGSNYKNYKHKYYLMYMEYESSLKTNKYDYDEVSIIQWKSYSECINSIRPYNTEKI